jgi:integrase
LKLPPEPDGEAIPLLPRTKPVAVRTKGPRRGVSINSKSISKSRWEMNFKSFLRNDVMHYLYGTNEGECERRYNFEWAHLVPHSLRHTRLLHLAKSGKDLLWLQKFAGHSSAQYTSIYYPSTDDLDFDVWET